MSADAAISLDRLTKDYGGRRALDAVTVEIPRGRVGLLGPNGAGKSTLIKCLLGLVKPTAGRGAVLGFDIARRPLALRERVGYFPEVDCHVPDVNAAELVTLMGELAGLPRADAIRRTHEVLDYVGLAEERYRPVGGYSAGMRQRVKLAQAIVHDPELLLLDEPTNALDPVSREKMLDLIRDLSERRGMAIIYSSHLLADVERVCDHVVILRGGTVLAQGRLDDLRRGQTGAVDVRVGGPAEAVAAFRARLEPAGLRVLELTGDVLRLTARTAGADRQPAADTPAADTPAAGAPAAGAPAADAPAAGTPAAGTPAGQAGAPVVDVSRMTLEAARDAGVQLRSFRPVRASLEDVFMEVVGGVGRAGASPAPSAVGGPAAGGA